MATRRRRRRRHRRAGVAQFQRRDQGEPLATGEHRLTYRIRKGRLRVGVDAFYFQEGLADTYQPARYGEMRVAADGTSLLVGLRDADGVHWARLASNA